MGTHGLARMNDSDRPFADFCLEKHKATWVSSNHTTESQIDHTVISRRYTRSLLDVGMKRGADAAFDHHLPFSKIQLNLRNQLKQLVGGRNW